MLRINDDRTIAVDETIQIIPGNQPIGKLTFAEAPPNSKRVEFLVNRASTTVNGATADLKLDNVDNSLAATLAADQNKSPIQVHVNYSVLGAFSDRSGGSLGSRSTLSWNIIPSDWPSTTESSSLEVTYPDGKVPLYIGADMDKGPNRSEIVKTQTTAFTGKVEAFNVSEGKGGITLQPPSGVAANAGVHVLISFSRADLTAAPKKLTATATPSPTKRPKPAAHAPPPSSTAPSPIPVKVDNGIWPIVWPLLPSILFFFLYFRRFPFFRGHSLPTSAVPQGMGPAEAGYLLEGTLRPRHVLGALTAVAEGGFSTPGSATIGADQLGPVERRALEILKRRPNIGSADEAKSYLSGSIRELEQIVIQSLSMQRYLYPSAKRSKAIPAGSLLVAIAITAFVAIEQNVVFGGISSAVSLLVGALLLYTLSPLTQKGVQAYQKLRGLERFLSAHNQELQTENSYVESLRPYAVAFGVVKQ